jgi:multimeric flavodoxin WrbA
VGDMGKVLVINGSPNMEKGYTSMILASFIEGMKKAGAEPEIYYAKKLNVAPCRGEFDCWYKKPGECIIDDNMQLLYDALKESEILIIATPVYAPLPGELQNILNRLMPMIEPVIKIKQGRMRARCHKETALKKVLAVTTGGWWEKENSEVVVSIVKEMAKNCNIEFSGSIIRPHVDAMGDRGKFTEDGQSILNTVKEAGSVFISSGSIPKKTFDEISKPLIDEKTYLNRLNQSYLSVR